MTKIETLNRYISFMRLCARAPEMLDVLKGLVSTSCRPCRQSECTCAYNKARARAIIARIEEGQ